MKKYYVVIRNGKWAIRLANSEKVSWTFDTQGAAIKKGQEMGKEKDIIVYIQGKDGKFIDVRNYVS